MHDYQVIIRHADGRLQMGMTYRSLERARAFMRTLPRNYDQNRVTLVRREYI